MDGLREQKRIRMLSPSLHTCPACLLPAPQLQLLHKGLAATEGGGFIGPAWGGQWSGEGHILEAKYCCPDTPLGTFISDNVCIFNSLLQQMFINSICQILDTSIKYWSCPHSIWEREKLRVDRAGGHRCLELCRYWGWGKDGWS